MSEPVAIRSDIKLLALDIDGVMTDGGMYYTEGGEEVKRFDTKDGRGIIHLQREGVPVAVLSSGFKSTIIAERCKTLGIEKFYVGTEPKLDILKRYCVELEIDLGQVAYIGDDINDRDIIHAVGFSACPADAVGSIKKIVDVVLEKNGGYGCIREFIDEHLGYHF
ncbi:MAG: HAD hydrolase family protein [Thiohalophilus sp.]|uniref:KdsC family phosphatase n=1 Tax=Thiohalophilus sp. TaxID=3028392 RepID=UPI00286FC75D|nr:HAD family hydrolase [Thiohalophilus sp.]MDR9437203.1 HAD hydrolase family protein [Thiohalophilus sp.]